MDLTITRDTGMDKTKPNNASPKSTVWPVECYQDTPLKQGEFFSYARPECWLPMESAACPLLRAGWVSGKLVELWDSNVHRVVESLPSRGQSARNFSQLRH